MASHAQQFSPFFDGQPQQTNPFLLTQPHHDTFHQNYIAQPLQPEPWNSQGNSRSLMTPRTGGVIFDAVTDPLDYGHYLVESWAESSTDPNYLISPNETFMPSQESFFNYQTAPDLALRTQVTIPPLQMHQMSPARMQVIRSSPPPDQQNFVNYNASSTLFTDNYITEPKYSPSSPSHSFNGQHPRSPYQADNSPSAGSPGSSDGAFSYQQSDPGMMMDTFPIQQPNQGFTTQDYAAQANFTPTKTEQEMSFDMASESESSASALKALGKNGGRMLGTHLEPEVAKAAHDMRKISACWHCVLQRDKCGPGDICERCLKRSQRPNADCGLGCIRIKLVELSPYFLPGLVTQMHEDSYLKHFVSKHVHGWGNVEFTVHMTCGGTKMPRLPVKVYEFVPNGNELLVQIQYVTDPHTKKRVARKKMSPALGMVHINHNEEKIYDKYITDIVDHHLDAFGELCWMEDDNDFLQKLFKLMTRVKPKNDDEVTTLPPTPHSKLADPHHSPNSSAKSSASSS
jgi:hypothetical protein